MRALALALALGAAPLNAAGFFTGPVNPAQPAAAPATAAQSASPSASVLLKGRWGIGYDQVPGASIASASSQIPGLAQANALAVRYWVTEDLAWDGLLAMDLSSQPSGSTGAAAGTDQHGYGLGTVLKLNLKRPTPWLMAQLLGRASLAQLSQSDNTGSGAGQTTTTFGVGLGAGFEAFLPVWDALSLEGSVNIGFSSSQTKVNNAQGAAQNGSSLSINGNGFSPLSLAIHLYF
jgi:hypothetical protein